MTGSSCASAWPNSATRWSAASPAQLTEDEFKPLRLMNGLYLQLHAYMLRCAVPYGVLSSRPDAPVRACRARLRPRLRPLHHPAEPAVQLDQAGRRAGHAGGAGRSRHARHPDQRQLRAQRHHRRICRRRGGRNRRSARLCRNPAPVVDAAPRVQLSAAQVQDRHHRRHGGPRRDPGARHRAGRETSARPARPASRCGSAAGSAACPSWPTRSATGCRKPSSSATWKPSCACTTRSAGARTSTRRASRSWCATSATPASPRWWSTNSR